MRRRGDVRSRTANIGPIEEVRVMRTSLSIALSILALPSWLVDSPALAAGIQDANAAVVLLRADCTVDGSELDNCVETMAELG